MSLFAKCDEPGCEAVTDDINDYPYEGSFIEAKGWQQTYGCDYCPDHARTVPTRNSTTASPTSVVLIESVYGPAIVEDLRRSSEMVRLMLDRRWLAHDESRPE